MKASLVNAFAFVPLVCVFCAGKSVSLDMKFAHDVIAYHIITGLEHDSAIVCGIRVTIAYIIGDVWMVRIPTPKTPLYL